MSFGFSIGDIIAVGELAFVGIIFASLPPTIA